MIPNFVTELAHLHKLISFHLRSVAPDFEDRFQAAESNIMIRKPVPFNTNDRSFELVTSCISNAKKNLASFPLNLKAMSECIFNIAPALRWYTIPARTTPPEFQEGHLNAMIFGPNGLATFGNLMLGVTVMRPGLTYPEHRHRPEELYIALSDSEWWRESAFWHRPGIGGTVHSPGNHFHSMRSGNTHHLSLWLLFGDEKFVPGAE
ncbi:dimethylsulfonioproprionate lyase family protein [Pseudomonas fluorescens]|uniref:dimethylsulfonioproprionate lyase family protein n=1 Tax=Pseudomonas fluorescens TaxID=294 RepID=UPI0010DB4E22|nr:dimethylsulfonioproprionate lyase family protein [Pseudomonas fluorescens]TCV66188.1 dimethlysulfoniopropionate lyase [Pseudomonas fluorescens]